MLRRILFVLVTIPLIVNAQIVSVKNGHFERGGFPYRVNGANMWYAGVIDEERMCRELDTLQYYGINNLRVMASAEGQPKIADGGFVAQTNAGMYSEEVLVRLDRLMVELGKRGMTAVLFLTNAWDWSGGCGTYLNWAGDGEATYQDYGEYCRHMSRFYSNEQAQEMFSAHVRKIVTRVNTITGRPYAEDEALMAWQICNEPRPFSKQTIKDMQLWIAKTAALIKSLDSNHMVSTGSEGRVGCEMLIEEYVDIHKDNNIDYLTIHIWPTMWGWASKNDFAHDLGVAKDMTGKYLDEHISIAKKLNKPIVLEEFGYPRDAALQCKTDCDKTEEQTKSRDSYYRFVYDKCRKIDGLNFWSWGGEAIPSQYLSMWQKGMQLSGDPCHEPQGLFSVYGIDKSTIEIFRKERPSVKNRTFRSKPVEELIERMTRNLPNDTLARIFTACFPNTLDKAIQYVNDEPFVITGDIDAMWLRDSGAQVWPYISLIAQDKNLKNLIKGIINQQLRYLLTDPYANAFRATEGQSEWANDYTNMSPMVHERKWELDSPCYVLRLIYGYWENSKDNLLIKSDLFINALEKVLDIFKEQQRIDGNNKTTYKFGRKTHAMHDTTSNYGYGHPIKPNGMIASMFRPSDDCCLFPFLVPSNFMAQDVLKKTASMMREVWNIEGQIIMPESGEVKLHEYLIATAETMADEIGNALKEHAIVQHAEFGNVYAYEVDGFGSHLLQDDANVPSLLSLPYLVSNDIYDEEVYQNTRRMILSKNNPYYFEGKDGCGIGSQHTSLDNIWPMSLIMQALTSKDKTEIEKCLHILVNTTANTYLMHESFNKDNANQYTREWFAWANTLFGELILKIFDRK